MKKQINDLLLKMQTGENCMCETANKLLDLYSVSISFSKDDMKKCADFWNGKHIEQKYFDQYLNER